MAEVIGLAASIIQIAGAGAKLSTTLYKFVDSATRADQEINDIAGDVEITANALDSVGRVFENEEAHSIISKKAIQDANNLIKRCEVVFQEINEVIEKRRKPGKDGKQGLSVRGKFSWPMKEQRIQILRGRLESLKNSLILLFHVLQLANAQAKGKLENSALKDERERIRQLHQRQQESLKCLQLLETKLCKVSLEDDEETLAGSSLPSRVATMDSINHQVSSTSKTKEDAASLSSLTASVPEGGIMDDSETSDSDGTVTDEEGEQMTIEDLSKCAKHVQKLLQRISSLQQSFEAQASSRQPKSRVRKLYRRFCQKFESDILQSTSANISLPLPLPAFEPPSKSSGPLQAKSRNIYTVGSKYFDKPETNFSAIEDFVSSTSMSDSNPEELRVDARFKDLNARSLKETVRVGLSMKTSSGIVNIVRGQACLRCDIDELKCDDMLPCARCQKFGIVCAPTGDQLGQNPEGEPPDVVATTKVAITSIPYVLNDASGSTMDHTQSRRMSKGNIALKPHKCYVCGEAFPQFENLGQHVKKHARDVDRQTSKEHSLSNRNSRSNNLPNSGPNHVGAQPGAPYHTQLSPSPLGSLSTAPTDRYQFTPSSPASSGTASKVKTSLYSQGTAADADAEAQSSALAALPTSVVTTLPQQAPQNYLQAVSPLPESVSTPGYTMSSSNSLKQRRAPYSARQTSVTLPIQIDGLRTPGIAWNDPFSQSPKYSSSSGYASPILGAGDYANMYANPGYGLESNRKRTSSSASLIDAWGCPSRFSRYETLDDDHSTGLSSQEPSKNTRHILPQPATHHHHHSFSFQTNTNYEGTLPPVSRLPSLVGQEGMPPPAARPYGRKSSFTSEADRLLIQLKEKHNLAWNQIADFFPGRSSGTLQVRYCTRLKNRNSKTPSALQTEDTLRDSNPTPILEEGSNYEGSSSNGKDSQGLEQQAHLPHVEFSSTSTAEDMKLISFDDVYAKDSEPQYPTPSAYNLRKAVTIDLTEMAHSPQDHWSQLEGFGRMHGPAASANTVRNSEDKDHWPNTPRYFHSIPPSQSRKRSRPEEDTEAIVMWSPCKDPSVQEAQTSKRQKASTPPQSSPLPQPWGISPSLQRFVTEPFLPGERNDQGEEVYGTSNTSDLTSPGGTNEHTLPWFLSSPTPNSTSHTQRCMPNVTRHSLDSMIQRETLNIDLQNQMIQYNNYGQGLNPAFAPSPLSFHPSGIPPQRPHFKHPPATAFHGNEVSAPLSSPFPPYSAPEDLSFDFDSFSHTDIGPYVQERDIVDILLEQWTVPGEQAKARTAANASMYPWPDTATPIWT